MKMEFIRPLPLIINCTWDSRHLGILDLDEDIEEVGDVVGEGDEAGAIIDNVGFDWRTVGERFWNPDAGQQLATLFRYDPAYYRIQWTVEDGVPGDSILFQVSGPGTDPEDKIAHHTHMEIIENASGLENSTSNLDTVWLPGLEGSSFLDVQNELKVRVLGIYDPAGKVKIRLSVTLLGGMVVQEAESWSIPKLVLTRRTKDLPRAVTNPDLPSFTPEASDELQALMTPIQDEAGPGDSLADDIQSMLAPAADEAAPAEIAEGAVLEESHEAVGIDEELEELGDVAPPPPPMDED